MSQRIEWIDTVKTLTMLLVVIGHCNYYTIETPYGGIHYLTESCNISTAYKCLRCIVVFIYSFHMPLFMSLSGMCFSISMKKNMNIKDLIHNKILRLLLPFLSVSLFLSIPIKFATGYWDGSETIPKDIIYGQLLLMGNSHLWFLASLFWIFIAYYMIEKSGWKGCSLWVTLLIISWVGFYIEPNCNFIGLPAAMKHLFFFACGYNMLSWINAGVSRKIVPVLLLAGMFLLQRVYISWQCHDVLFLRILEPVLFTFFALCGIYSLCTMAKLLPSIKKKRKVLSFMKNNTFEMYLYSDPFNYLLIFLGYSIMDENLLTNSKLTLLMFCIRVVGTMVFAMIVIGVVRVLRLKSLQSIFSSIA
ncbi:MAG: acyltransferase [Bacteroidaceae bacterium]|nr:acyltransferase [Bacteroidaceae bacterium]